MPSQGISTFAGHDGCPKAKNRLAGNTSSEADSCMICLCPLLVDGSCYSNDEGIGKQDSTADEALELGAVFPCGHVFHVFCFTKWKGERCPCCNQDASLFSKIYMSTSNTLKSKPALDLASEERLELERYRQKEREEEEDRALINGIQEHMDQDPEGAKMVMTMTMMMQSRDLRRAERELQACQEECDSTKEILRVTQQELEESNQQLDEWKPKAESLQDELDRLKRVRRETATQRHQQHKQKLASLQEQVNRYKDKLAIKNRQLARRNKELAAKRKLISSHKLELAAKGMEHKRMCEKTREELERTKKELELMRELDSLTMGEGSFHSFGNGSLRWD